MILDLSPLICNKSCTNHSPSHSIPWSQWSQYRRAPPFEPGKRNVPNGPATSWSPGLTAPRLSWPGIPLCLRSPHPPFPGSQSKPAHTRRRRPGSERSENGWPAAFLVLQDQIRYNRSVCDAVHHLRLGLVLQRLCKHLTVSHIQVLEASAGLIQIPCKGIGKSFQIQVI